MFNIVIFGAPGCGKGTQSEKIIEAFGLHHISTGELLRSEIASGSELGKVADSFISNGQLIPDDLMVRILAKELKKPAAEKGVIFDGFPRTIPQAEELKKILSNHGSKVHAVIGLEVPDEELTQRLIKRGIDSGRSDDNPEAIAKRLEVYHHTTKPLREYYTNEGCYHNIKGSGAIDDIFSLIRQAIESAITN